MDHTHITAAGLRALGSDQDAAAHVEAAAGRLAKRCRALEASRPYPLLPGYSETYSTVCTFVSPAMHARCQREACGCPCHGPREEGTA